METDTIHPGVENGGTADYETNAEQNDQKKPTEVSMRGKSRQEDKENLRQIQKKETKRIREWDVVP